MAQTTTAQLATPQSRAPTATGLAPGPTPGSHTEIAEIAEGHGGAFPPFRSDTFVAQILWVALAFGLLYYLMSKFALPRIGTILHERASRLGADLGEAHRMRAEAEAAGSAYEAALKAANDRSKGIAQGARDAAAAEADTRRKAVEADLAQKLAASEATIRARTASAMTNVREIAGDTASAIVERLTGQAPDRGQLDAALDRTLAH